MSIQRLAVSTYVCIDRHGQLIPGTNDVTEFTSIRRLLELTSGLPGGPLPLREALDAGVKCVRLNGDYTDE